MSKERQETIADIVAEMRIGDLCASDTAARSMYINDFLDSYADRIEAAHKREILVERNLATDHIVKERQMVKNTENKTPYEIKATVTLMDGKLYVGQIPICTLTESEAKEAGNSVESLEAFVGSRLL